MKIKSKTPKTIAAIPASESQSSETNHIHNT